MNETMTKTNALTGAEYPRAKFSVEVTPYDLNALLEKSSESVVVIDVRDPSAFEAEHIRGAVSIPLSQLTAMTSSLPKDKPVVTYCWDMTCGLAPKAALTLLEKCFRVRYMVGGLAQWTHKGFRTEKKG